MFHCYVKEVNTPTSSLHFLLTSLAFAVPRTPPRNIQVYNPTPNSLNVRWEPASGQVQQYRVAYAPLTGVRPSESVSYSLQAVKMQTVIRSRICFEGTRR